MIILIINLKEKAVLGPMKNMELNEKKKKNSES